MIGNNHTAASSGFLGINSVFDPQTSGLDSVVQDGGILVVANTTEEDDGVGRKHILCTTSGILGSAAGNQFCGVVVQEVFVDAGVFFFSEDGIVGLEAIFLEESSIALSLDIWVARC